jgi:threonine/homoserine/homoserine lactone efflux protein
MSDTDRNQARAGRRAAMVIAGTAILWVAATMIGTSFGLSQRELALFDLMALGGFLWAVWMIYNIWRARQDNQR